MAHVNPIQSRPLSEEGRDNYDRIFRKPQCDGSDESWLRTMDANRAIVQTLFESEPPYSIEELKTPMPMERINYELIRQKQIDQSA
jgi:hypothetical protein